MVFPLSFTERLTATGHAAALPPAAAIDRLASALAAQDLRLERPDATTVRFAKAPLWRRLPGPLGLVRGGEVVAHAAPGGLLLRSHLRLTALPWGLGLVCAALMLVGPATAGRHVSRALVTGGVVAMLVAVLVYGWLWLTWAPFVRRVLRGAV